MAAVTGYIASVTRAALATSLHLRARLGPIGIAGGRGLVRGGEIGGRKIGQLMGCFFAGGQFFRRGRDR